MKFIPSKEASIQCPECGVPVDVVEVRGPTGNVELQPCGHLVEASRLVL